MASLHRLQWIDERIRHQLYPNINQIVERFEISRRQALRDIEYLRDSLGAPIEFHPQKKGYFYTNHSFTVPTQRITADQRELLACLSTHYEGLASRDYRNSEVFSALAHLLVRLSGKEIVPINKAFHLRDDVVPFYAILQAGGGRPASIPHSLQPYYRGTNDLQQDIVEFYDSHEFLPALLASGVAYRIVYPRWLKNKLVTYLELLRNVNVG